MFKGIEKSII